MFLKLSSNIVGKLSRFKEFKFTVCRDRCQKQNSISSLMYCNILTQGLSSCFFSFLLFKLRIARFTEVRFM